MQDQTFLAEGFLCIIGGAITISSFWVSSIAYQNQALISYMFFVKIIANWKLIWSRDKLLGADLKDKQDHSQHEKIRHSLVSGYLQ
jgi:hypothetical protein